MKENALKAVISAAFAAFAAAVRVLAAPLILVVLVMLADYGTGMARAWITKSFSSRFGLVGIVKKLLYLALVAVGMAADYLLTSAMVRTGIDLGVTGVAGLTVTVWLIINELISILENLAQSGAPVPDFLMKLMERLKIASEGDKK